ncbi:MAG: uroporphyrinogen-III synthase [Candidatus Cloacimonetes bacterium]|nr:uroporphyrinogen-III synthase [Candidatus Cloacimonadota bacterium]
MDSLDVLVWLRAEEDILEGRELFSVLGIPQKVLPSVRYETCMSREILRLSLEEMQNQPLLFASERAVRYFFEILGDESAVAILKQAQRIFCVGSRGRMLLKKKWCEKEAVVMVDCMASVLPYLPAGSTLRYPCSEQYVLKEVERALVSGIRLLPIPIYSSLPLQIDNSLCELFDQFDYPGFLVLAPSQARPLRNFTDRNFVSFCMGRRSFETLLAWGMPKVVSANEATLKGLLQAVKIYREEVRQ